MCTEENRGRVFMDSSRAMSLLEPASSTQREDCEQSVDIPACGSSRAPLQPQTTSDFLSSRCATGGSALALQYLPAGEKAKIAASAYTTQALGGGSPFNGIPYEDSKPLASFLLGASSEHLREPGQRPGHGVYDSCGDTEPPCVSHTGFGPGPVVAFTGPLQFQTGHQQSQGESTGDHIKHQAQRFVWSTHSPPAYLQSQVTCSSLPDLESLGCAQTSHPRHVMFYSSHQTEQPLGVASGQPYMSQSAHPWYLEPKACMCPQGSLPSSYQTHESEGPSGILRWHCGPLESSKQVAVTLHTQEQQLCDLHQPQGRDEASDVPRIQPGNEGPSSIGPDSTTPGAKSSDDPAGLVFVWDLDETLIVFNSLLNGRFSMAMNCTPSGPVPTTTASAPDLYSSSSACASQGMTGASGSDPSTLCMVQGRGDEAVAKAVRLQGASGMTPHDYHVLGDEVADFIFTCCDDLLNYKDVELLDPMTVDDVLKVGHSDPEEQCRKRYRPEEGPSVEVGPHLSVRRAYEAAKAFYLAGISALPPHLRDQALELREKVNRATNGWVQASIDLLTKLSEAAGAQVLNGEESESAAGAGNLEHPNPGGHPFRHCLVSTGQLLPTLFKLVLFGLSPWFDVEDVFSASKQTKLKCFQRLSETLSKPEASHGEEVRRSNVPSLNQVKFICIGDGPEEKRAAGKLKWPFVQICLAPPQLAAQDQSTAEWYEVGQKIMDVDYRALIALGVKGLVHAKS